MTDASADDVRAAAGESPRTVTMAEALALLSAGDLEVLGRLPWSSNGTFLAQLRGGDADALVVYKPARGERPLWDFGRGTLARREVASFAVAQAMGLELIPPTILRDGPAGEGAVQLFVEHDPEDHYFTLRERGDLDPVFLRFAAFDVVANNADRKAGHFLLAGDGHIWGIDHGLTFHVDPKLRTVVWEYAGTPLPEEITDGLCRLLDALEHGELAAQLRGLLDRAEIDALRDRTDHLLRLGAYPHPYVDYPYPWPMV
jgi:uncharacterized repeat protein (TIGR03843 family)